MSLILLVLAAVAAVGDWVAVGYRLFRLEYLLGPLALALLAAAAATAQLGPGRAWVVAALAFGLVGDVALLGRAGPARGLQGHRFLLGPAAFLLGHACYLVAFARHGLHPLFAVAGVLIVAGASALALPPVLRAVARGPGRLMTVAVGGYGAVLAAMTVLAVATGAIATAIGGLFFLGSDAVLGHDRFVHPLRRGRILVIVSYHLAQFLIVIGLIEQLS